MAWDQMRATYDVVADRYEQQFLDELDAKPRDRELLGAFAATGPDPVVDLGCGPGQVGALLHATGRRVVGVDLSEQMARRAATRLDQAVVADLRALPFATGAVGGIAAFYSLIHLPRAQLGPALRELRRVLRRGGRLLVTAHAGTGEVSLDEFLGAPVPFVASWFQLDELVEACSAAGFDVVQAEQRAPYPDEHPSERLAVEAVAS